MSGELSFIELGSEDPGKSKRFNEELFGWTFTPGAWGQAAGFDIAGLGTAAGIHGGDPAASPYVFFKVDDLNAAAAKVLELAGTVLRPRVAAAVPSGASLSALRARNFARAEPIR